MILPVIGRMIIHSPHSNSRVQALLVLSRHMPRYDALTLENAIVPTLAKCASTYRLPGELMCVIGCCDELSQVSRETCATTNFNTSIYEYLSSFRFYLRTCLLNILIIVVPFWMYTIILFAYIDRYTQFLYVNLYSSTYT